MNIQRNDKTVTIVDSCGHQKYLKSTIYGATSQFVDYGILVVASNKGVEGLPMIREHLSLLLNMNIPFAIFMTREDIAPSEIYDKNLKSIETGLRKRYKKQVTVVNKTMKIELESRRSTILESFNNEERQIINTALDKYFNTNITEQVFLELLPSNLSSRIKKCINDMVEQLEKNRIDEIVSLANDMKYNNFSVPIITISNKTGYFVRLAHQFIFNLQSKKEDWKDTDDTVFYIDGSFNVTGTGLVVSGTLRGKSIKANDIVYIGPYMGKFIEIHVRSIHDNLKNDIPCLTNTNRGCLAIKGNIDKKQQLEKKHIKRGF